MPEAIAAFKLAHRQPEPGGRAIFAASLLEGRGREEEARVHLVWLADDPRQGELSRTALWKLGWADYRNHRFGDAVQRFEDLAAATTDPVARLKPDYWRARALSQNGQPEEAALAFESLARDYPLSYYGWRPSPRIGSNESKPRALAPDGARRQAPVQVRILVDASLHEEQRDRRLVRLAVDSKTGSAWPDS
jgi:hypothetical protein